MKMGGLVRARGGGGAVFSHPLILWNESDVVESFDGLAPALWGVCPEQLTPVVHRSTARMIRRCLVAVAFGLRY